MDPVLMILIASCMTLTQFAIQLKDSITTSAYVKNFELLLDCIQAIHRMLEECKKHETWGGATDGAKKSFQKLEGLLRKATGVLQRCIAARSKLKQVMREHEPSASGWFHRRLPGPSWAIQSLVVRRIRVSSTAINVPPILFLRPT